HLRDLTGQEIVFVASNLTDLTWALGNNLFFAFYYPAQINGTSYWSQLNDVDIPGEQLASTFFLAPDPHHQAIDITQAARSRFEFIASIKQHVAYDFIKNFDNGEINNLDHVDTPTERGVLILPWKDQAQITQDALTVVCPFTYTFHNIHIEENDKLVLRAGIPYRRDTSTRIFIDIINTYGEKNRLFQTELPPNSTDVLVWSYFETSMLAYRG